MAWLFRLLSPLTFLSAAAWFCLDATKRQAVHRNRIFLFGRCTPWQAFLPFLHMHRTVLENVMLSKTKGATVRGYEHVRALRSKGHGVVHLTSHVGNWEIGARLTAALGIPLTVVIDSAGNSALEKRYALMRERAGLQTALAGGSAGTRACKALHAGRHLAIVFDMRPNDRGMKVRWFGRETVVSRGPFWLAQKTGSPIVPTFCVRSGWDSFELIFEEPVFPSDSAFVEKIVSCMEKYQREYWNQWAMFMPLENFLSEVLAEGQLKAVAS